MARAKTGTGFFLVVGLLAAAAPAAVRGADDAARVAQLFSSKPSRELGEGIEAQRHGDYDRAYGLLQDAAAGQASLTETEKQELGRVMKDNGAALDGRRAASEQLRLAQNALKEHRQADAVDLLKRVAVNEQYLTSADRQAFRQCSAGLNLPVAGGPPVAPVMPSAAAPAVNPASQARSLVRQARGHLVQGDFDLAEKEARDAAALKAAFAKNEDSPARILDDLTRSRADATALLKAARAALLRKDYDKAEQYAHQSEKASSTWAMVLWGDTPAKALKDIQAARGERPRADAPKGPVGMEATKPGPKKADAPPTVVQSAKPAESTAAASVPAAAKNTEQARALMAQARKALQAGDHARAHKLIDEARALKPDLQWYEDNPDKLQAEVARAEAAARPAPDAAADKDAPAPADAKAKAVALLKQGRQQLADNKLDEAVDTVGKLRAAKNVTWGLFEDSPEALRRDVEAARLKRDRDESVKVLAEARKLIQQGDYEGAERAAYRAQTLHGPYGYFEIGDRPRNVLADLESTRAKNKNPLAKPAADLAANPAGPGAPAVNAQRPIVPPAPSSTAVTAGPPAAPVPVADANKAKALQLLAEARELGRQNRLVEARAKAAEAAVLRASFEPTEESPEQVLQQCSGLARHEVSRLMTVATDAVNYGEGDPVARCAKADQALMQARALATAFGQDTQPVEIEMAHVRQVRAVVLKQPAAGPNVTQTAPPASPVAGPGASPTAASMTPAQQLDMARRELTAGSTGTARKIAEEVYSTHPEARGAAETVLRSIDAEETAQLVRQDRKTFDAAVSSYNRRDYAYARRLIDSVDVRRLDQVRTGHLREMMETPEMQPGRGLVQVAAVGGEGVGAKETTPAPQPAADAPGKARASDDPGVNLLKSTEAMRQVKFQQLRRDGLEVQAAAQQKAGAGQTDAAIDLLQQYLAKLDDEPMDPAQLTLLRRPVESRLQKFRILKIEDDFGKSAGGDKAAADLRRINKDKAEQNKEEKVAELMKQFNEALKAGKYPEAQRAAEMAHDLDPDNPSATAAVSISKMAEAHAYGDKRRQQHADVFEANMRIAEDEGPPVSGDHPLYVDPKMERITQGRKLGGVYVSPTKSEKEREIERKLTTPTTLNFDDVPLHRVVDELRAFHNMNIYVDQQALDNENISLEHPISIKLDQVSLKSALNLILRSVHLTYIIKDEVLQITTESQAKGKLMRATYQVADLVIPVPNSAGVLPPVAQGNNAPTPSLGGYPPTPMPGPYSIQGGTPTGTATGGSPFATDANGTTIFKTDPVTRQDQLIKLITNTVDPRSWSDMGGPGTIDYHPMTMGLVINQTPDIQEQIQDLLNSLRRLQDQEVALEVRFISISDDFFERIGVDFALNITNNKANEQVGPQLTSGIFKPAGLINTFTPNNVTVGVSGPGRQLTNDLGIPIAANSFSQTFPQFGGYVPGFSLGLAFLSEIQVFLFMEAVQGDNRVNVMQAPRLTAFNGQTATLSVQDQQPFVTGAQVIIGPTGTPIFQPIITPNVGSGVQLNIQPVISADRRFVRLNFGTPQVGGGGGFGQIGGGGFGQIGGGGFGQIGGGGFGGQIGGGFGGQIGGQAGGGVTLINMVPGPVATFPIVVPVFSGTPLNGNTDPNQVVFTQLIQQPVQQIITISTTVSVPDGGTVVMGGLKRLEEARSEYGPPILSKIPYINRLFKNVGYGRSAESLLIMVTPRIIIQQEEEERQTGFNADAAQGTGQ